MYTYTEFSFLWAFSNPASLFTSIPILNSEQELSHLKVRKNLNVLLSCSKLILRALKISICSENTSLAETDPTYLLTDSDWGFGDSEVQFSLLWRLFKVLFWKRKFVSADKWEKSVINKYIK